MFFGKLSDFGCFLLDAIFANMPVCAMPTFVPLNICAFVWKFTETIVWKFTDVVCRFYCVLCKLTFALVLVLWPLVI